ncbi:MAG TPA: oleate hydratase, partial [Ignavibacteriaceae bacterium]
MSGDIVIGAGIAGLSAAVYLSAGGRRVELIEASQKPGGRAYSLTEKSTGTIIDNGQHIMMGCYYDTLKFFRMIGAYENLIIQEKLSVDFLLPQLQSVPLKAFSKIYPLNLSAGLLAYRALSIKDRLLLLRFFLVLPLVSDNDLKRKTVYDWLVQENQNERIRKAFWEILVAGALNTSTYKASAKIFKDILVEIFLKGNKAATIVIPKKGLTESYCDPAINYIGSRGGIVTMGEQVNKLIIED